MIETLAEGTASAARGHDTQEALALAALAATGVSVDVVDWDDATVDWTRYDRLLPAVPTTVLAPGDEPSFPAGEIVVKPAVGAGSRDTASYGPEDLSLARAHVRRLHEDGRTVIVQPLLASVAADGEWASFSKACSATRRTSGSTCRARACSRDSWPRGHGAARPRCGAAGRGRLRRRARRLTLRDTDVRTRRPGARRRRRSLAPDPRAHGLTGPRSWVDQNHSSAAAMLDP